jgi:hypothetical protein
VSAADYQRFQQDQLARMAEWAQQGQPQAVDELRQANDALRERLERLTRLDLEGAHCGLQGIADLARKYLPADQHETALYLLRLAYTRGRCDEVERGHCPPIVLHTCPACGGKGEG